MVFSLTAKAKIRQDSTREPLGGGRDAQGTMRLNNTKAAVHRGK
jgi:hypothetical protein